MIPYQKEKLDNAVCFFAKEHNKKTRHQLYQTFLYKYLALFDFGCLKTYGKAPLGLTYVAMPRGPVPKELYDRRDDADLSAIFCFRKDERQNLIVLPKTPPNLDYFNKREVDFMHRLIEVYAQTYITSALMSDASHQEILAWKRTWKEKQNTIIDLSLEFSGDIFHKPETELTFPEEVFLTQKGIEHCGSPSAT